MVCIAKAQRMTNPAAFAKKAVKETPFIYSKANKMRWGRGPVGRVAMTFKTCFGGWTKAAVTQRTLRLRMPPCDLALRKHLPCDP